MTIWILALMLLASLAGLGYRQGALRVAFSLGGIIFGALVSPPLGHLLQPLLKSLGAKNPALAWALGPLIVFMLVLIIFKMAGLVVHRKVNIYYKYHAGLQLPMWERLNRRLGLCLGLLNGTIYLILISFVVYGLGYWTVQMSVSDQTPKAVRFLNRMANDLQSTGMSKVGRSVGALPDSYYDAADIVGLIYANPLLEGRLSRYPGFLSLAERQEFQDLGSDTEYLDLRLKQASIAEVLHYPKVKAILDNPELLTTIWNTMIPDLKDLRAFLETGLSAKYDDEKILGRWTFNVNASIAAYRKTKPTVAASDIQRFKRWMIDAFQKTSFVAGPDHLAILKGRPQMPAGNAQTTGAETLRGEWQADGSSNYQLKFTNDGKTEELAAALEGGRLTINNPGLALVFTREE